MKWWVWCEERWSHRGPRELWETPSGPATGWRETAFQLDFGVQWMWTPVTVTAVSSCHVLRYINFCRIKKRGVVRADISLIMEVTKTGLAWARQTHHPLAWASHSTSLKLRFVTHEKQILPGTRDHQADGINDAWGWSRQSLSPGPHIENERETDSLWAMKWSQRDLVQRVFGLYFGHERLFIYLSIYLSVYLFIGLLSSFNF